MNSDSGKVIKAGVGYTLGNFLVKGLNFLTIPLFARLLSASDYGLYNTYLAYEGILFSVIGLALQMSLKNAKYAYGKKYEEYVSSIILLEIILMFLWLAVAYVLEIPLSEQIEYNQVVVYILIIHCSCSSIFSLYNIHLSLSYSYKEYVVVTAINAILNILLSVLLILTLFDSERYIGRVIGTVIPFFVLSVYICFKFWIRCAPKINYDFWKFAVIFSIPLIPHAISQVVLNQFDRIMIMELNGSNCSGIYSFAYNIYLIIAVVMASLDNVWSPWFYERFSKGNAKEIRERSKMYAGGMLILSVIVMLLSPELVKILGTAEYYDAIYSVIPVCAGGYFMFLYSIPAQVEYYHGKTYYIALGTAVAAILNIALNIIFIPYYGYVSAAYTTEVTYILYFILHYFIAKRIIHHSLFDGKTFFVMGLLCVGMSILGILMIEMWYVRWIIVLLISVGLYYYISKRGYFHFLLKITNH